MRHVQRATLVTAARSQHHVMLGSTRQQVLDTVQTAQRAMLQRRAVQRALDARLVILLLQQVENVHHVPQVPSRLLLQRNAPHGAHVVWVQARQLRAVPHMIVRAQPVSWARHIRPKAAEMRACR